MPGTIVDDGLLERARHGDAAAFAVIYEELAPRVLRFLDHQVGDRDLAEELLQRTFVKIIEALPRFQRRRDVPFSAWVFRVARNVVIDERRTAHPAVGLDEAPDVPSGDPGPERLVEACLERDELLHLLERLPADQHDVLVYRFFAGLEPAEVAPLLNRSAGAVRVLQHRALQRLRQLMAPTAPRATARAAS